MTLVALATEKGIIFAAVRK